MKYTKAVSCGLAMLAGASALLSVSGCAQKAQAVAPDGSFRLTVKDLVSDPSLQVEQITIEKTGTGSLQGDGDVKHSGFQLNSKFGPLPNKDTGTAELVFVADMVPGQRPGSRTLHLAGQVSTVSGSSYGSATVPVPNAPASPGPLFAALKPGVYPLGTHLQLGPVGGKPIVITVSAGEE